MNYWRSWLISKLNNQLKRIKIIFGGKTKMKISQKIAVALVFLIGAILLSGCGGGEKRVGPSTTPFVGGVTALRMEFVEGAPPEEIFDNGNFPFAINIKIENLGESDVTASDGYVEITGIDPVDFGLSNQAELKKQLPSDVRGVVKNFEGTVLVGETLIAEFNDLNFMKNIRGNWDGPRIRANLCYNYETEATTIACMKRDMLTNIGQQEICELSGIKPVYNSGAPIQITNVHQTPLGSDKIQLQFEISHVGSANDRFYKTNTECDDRSTNIDKDIVHFEIMDSAQDVKCSGLQNAESDSSGFVTLYNGKPRTIICSFDVTGVEGMFEKQITAKLGYRYSQFIEKTILVKDVSTSAGN
jgi:hypothetical protein